MPSRVQVESQADSHMREAVRAGGPVPFMAAGLRPNAKPEMRMTAREMRPKLRKGFMRGGAMTGFMRQLAAMFQAQRANR